MNAWLTNTVDWARLEPAASVLGGLATCLAAIVGGLSLLFIWIQTSRNSRVSREVMTLEAHQAYMRLCFENPELSSSYMMSKSLKIDDFDSLFNKVTPEGEKALWLISYVLFAMSQILLTKTTLWWTEKHWLRLVEAQLGYHRSFLKAAWPYWKDMYDPRMRRVIQRVINADNRLPGFDIGLPCPIETEDVAPPVGGARRLRSK